MPVVRRLQYGLRTLFVALAAISSSLALTSWLGVCGAFVPCVLVFAGAICIVRDRASRWCLVALATIYPCALLFVLLFAFVDVSLRGPFVSWYNETCYRKAKAAGLVGKPERMVVEILGEPTSTMDRGPGDNTYNYAPYAFFPGEKFQVHCKGGVVWGLEKYDW